MKTTSAKVFWQDYLVGEIVHSDKGFFFQYDKNFLKMKIELSPKKLKTQSKIIKIDPALGRISCFSGLPGVFADSLPDKFGTELLRKHFEEKGFNPETISPVQKLLYVGNTGMGALEYRPSERETSPEDYVVLELRKLVEQAKKVIEGNVDEKIPEIITIGSTAGGARAKGLIGWNRKDNKIIAGIRKLPPEFEYWLIKFDGVEGKEVGWGKIEYIYSIMAQQAGINMAETYLLKDREHAHFMTKRFDRTAEGKKIHFHSLCGITQVDYNSSRLFDYESFMRETLAITKSYPDVEQVFKVMTFNILSVNHDDHIKNFGYLMNDKGIWNISPAYDLCYSNWNNPWGEEHQLTVSGKLGSEVKKNDLLKLASKLSINNAEEIILKIQESLSNWEKLAENYEVDEEKKNLISKELKKRTKDFNS